MCGAGGPRSFVYFPPLPSSLLRLGRAFWAFKTSEVKSGEVKSGRRIMLFARSARHVTRETEFPAWPCSVDRLPPKDETRK